MRRLALFLMLAAGGGASGCGDPTGAEALAGEYQMTILLLKEGTDDIDLMALGMRATFVLLPNGSTKGFFRSPGTDGLDDNRPFDHDLTGTYVIDRNTVVLTHEADTFLRDAPLLIEGSRLRSTYPDLDAVFERR